ncbi:putative myb dna-binding domain-containing protein [Phaeomoniella chlamydospora]|uniref:Putative myb dna-binding domain-containing protein n=1 Tax=Phaeomoniella chlamydospora TaxID=158046 RepID=A0A0G2H0I3_PHACM|nr:putative myb dna-binding domain-containing protein [Phaeomoniella chlamydospora]
MPHHRPGAPAADRFEDEVVATGTVHEDVLLGIDQVFVLGVVRANVGTTMTREPDRPSDRDERDRDGGWQKEMRPLGPTTPGSVAGSMKTPLSTPSSHSRTVENPAVKPTYDTPRRYSSSLTTSSGRKDNEKGDYFLSKPDPPSRAGLQRPASPQAAPQVPAFGAAIPYLGTTTQTSSAPKTAPAEKPLTTPKAPVQPDGPPANNAAPMQPPTAPRAQRDSSVPIQAASKGPGTSVQTKEEERPLKAPTGPSATRVDTIPTAPRSAIATDNRENANGPFQNIPSGPKARTLSSSSLRSDTPTGPATSPRPPFAAAPRPFGVDTSAPTPFASTIPTGPRSQRSAPAPKNQWISKDYNARKQPGAIQTSPPAPSSAVDSKEKLVGGLMSVRGTFAQGKENGPLGRNNEQLPDAQDRDDVKPIKEDLDRASEVKEQAGTAVTNMEESDRPTWSMQEPPSDEEPDDLGLDEEDFAASEARFREQQEKHASRKPPLPMDDAVVRELLVKIQLLGLIVAGDVPAELLQKKDGPNAADVEMADADQEVVPKIEEPEEDPVPKGRPLKEKPTISTETPPVDNLPFRTSGPPTPFSDFGVLDDDAEKRQALQECFRQDFEKQKVENEDKKLRLKEEFKEYYKPWRLTVDDLDRKKKAEKPLTPAPASPTLSSTTTAAPTPSLERTRGGRNMTELDIQNILKESEESARQEQERRDREDKKDPDYDKEAVIPAMIDNFERDEDNFNDTNQLIPPERALEVFGFVPPQDDFTEDEQKKFTQGFIDFPKKWGKIAQYVAETERDYHDCIVHYYLTKKEAGYKDILRRNQSRKGRKKGPKGGAKSNALMADLGVRPELYEGDEFDSAPAPVTDTGRPRRAAAPVFGDKEATDDGTSGSTSGKRGAASKDTNGDPNPDKPAKGRKAGGRTRKTKAKDSAAPPSAAQSPQKVDKEPVLAIKNGRAQTKELLPVPPEEIPVIDLQRPIDIKQPQVPPVVDGEPQSLVQVPTVQASQSSQPSQPSSYWSVPEQKDFPKLLAHFGKDFDAIATYMRTKTAIMVKNYFVRQCETKPELEVIAQDADAKKRRGIQTAPLPIPTTATPKRKYDATPSSVVQRPLAPSTETLNPGEEVSRDALQRPLLEEPAMPTGQRSPVKELHHRHQQQPVSIQSRPQVNPLAPRVEDTYQPGRPPAVAAQRPDQGPRRGFFAEDRPERRQSVSLTQPPIQIPPQQTVDRARPEQPPRHANLAPSRAPVSSAAQAPYPGTAMPGISQAPYMQQVGAQPVQSRSPMRHARNLSSTGHGSPVQAVLKHEPDTAPLRRPDSQTTFIPSYAGSPAQSPAMPRPVQPVHIPREPLRPSSTPAPPIEPPKVTPAKRSNIMSILNDEPSEGPPQKRPSLENNANRGPPAPSSTQSLAHQQAHNYGQTMQSRRGEPPQPMHVQQQQPPPRSAFTTPVSSLHPSTMQPGHQLAEYSSSYRQEANQSPAGRDSWLARYDPRSEYRIPLTRRLFHLLIKLHLV